MGKIYKTKILQEPFKLWNNYTKKVLTSSAIICRIAGEMFKKRKLFFVMSIEQLHDRINELIEQNSVFQSTVNEQQLQITGLQSTVIDQQRQINLLKIQIRIPSQVIFNGFNRIGSSQFPLFSNIWTEAFGARHRFQRRTTTFFLDYFEITLQTLRSFKTIGLNNDDVYVYLGLDFPQLKIFSGNLHVELATGNIEGPVTFGCGIVFPGDSGFYAGLTTKAFFTLNGQRIGRYLRVNDNIQVTPTFEIFGKDVDIQAFAEPNFGQREFVFNLGDYNFEGEEYQENDWND
ncbi:hypothetical protein ACQ4LE_007661 [Meloidogyne hapla]